MSKNDIAVRDRTMARLHNDGVLSIAPAPVPEEPSVGELLRSLSSDFRVLVRQEIDLAKAEMREKVHVYQTGMITVAIGAVLMMAAALTGLWFLNQGLTALLVQFMPLAIAVWLAPLILTVAFAGFGWTMIKGAKEKMAREGLTPNRTLQTLAQDKRWAQAKVREVKENITHG